MASFFYQNQGFFLKKMAEFFGGRGKFLHQQCPLILAEGADVDREATISADYFLSSVSVRHFWQGSSERAINLSVIFSARAFRAAMVYQRRTKRIQP